MILTTKKYPDPVLLQKAKEVTRITERDQLLIRDMIDTMHAESGVGIGANQVGVATRIFITCPEAEPGKEIIFINPKITAKKGSFTDYEGCLSLPNIFEKVKRAKHITVEALNLKGKPFTLEAEDFHARIIQHELDHLDGILFINHINPLRRSLALRKFKKASKARK